MYIALLHLHFLIVIIIEIGNGNVFVLQIFIPF